MAKAATRELRPEPATAEAAERLASESLSSHDFSWFWRAYTVSIFGDQVTLVALPIAVFTRTNSALAVGIAPSMQAAPTLIFGLFARPPPDRLRARPVLIVTDVLRAGVLGFLATLVIATPDYPVWSLYVAAFLLGALGILHDAKGGAALPVVVSGKDLLRANGRLSGSEAVGNAGGPALAGMLTSVSVGLAFAVDSVTFVLSAFGITRVRAFHGRPTTAPHGNGSIFDDIREGIRA